MNRISLLSLGVLAAGVHSARAQWTTLTPRDTTAEYRGLYAVSATVAWAAGKGGHYARTTDGEHWTVGSVPGADSLFFIAVRPVSADTAYLCGTNFAGGLGKIFKTTDGGTTWTEQYANAEAGMFFDGMAFWDADHGLAFGDPLDGVLFMVTTDDGGATWTRVTPDKLPPSLPNEAAFAASGTAIAVQGSSNVWIGTGGATSARVYRSNDRGHTWSVSSTPLPAGPTAGIFGVSFRDALHGVAVGGDYSTPYKSNQNLLATDDGGETWRELGTAGPRGVRYGVAYIASGSGYIIMAVGPSGIGYSIEDGRSWAAVDTMNVNTVAGAGGAAWVAGVSGRIAKWKGPLPVPVRTR